MSLRNIIGGLESKGQTFEVGSPYPEFSHFTLELPKFSEEDLVRIGEGRVPDAKTRLDMLETLSQYSPNDRTIKQVSMMTGMPVSWVQNNIEQGIQMARNLLGLVSEPIDAPGRSTWVSIPPNDPREIFYFLSHIILAGSPAVVKLSAREPALGNDIFQYLREQTPITDFVDLVFGDTTTDTEYLVGAMEKTDVPILMGSTDLSLPGQITFDADLSRALVLDGEMALPHLEHSLRYPGSCLAERVIYVVGKSNFDFLENELKIKYQSLRKGDILHYLTEVGLISDTTTLESMINSRIALGTARVLQPSLKKITRRALETGTIVRTYPAADETKPSLLTCTPLPQVYLTMIRMVDSIRDAMVAMYRANTQIEPRYGKPMALAIYGEQAKDVAHNFESLAHDTKINQSPVEEVDGVMHQGVKLQNKLRGE